MARETSETPKKASLGRVEGGKCEEGEGETMKKSALDALSSRHRTFFFFVRAFFSFDLDLLFLLFLTF